MLPLGVWEFILREHKAEVQRIVEHGRLLREAELARAASHEPLFGRLLKRLRGRRVALADGQISPNGRTARVPPSPILSLRQASTEDRDREVSISSAHCS